jgi:AmiR/NasT family two-component response regulator
MGILMERHRLSEDEAFGVLRRLSQEHNVKLRDVARRVRADPSGQS